MEHRNLTATEEDYQGPRDPDLDVSEMDLIYLAEGGYGPNPFYKIYEYIKRLFSRRNKMPVTTLDKCCIEEAKGDIEINSAYIKRW